MESGSLALPTPFTPATTEADELLALRLIRSRRVGPATYFRLIAEFGTAGAALDALPEVARAAGVQGYAPCPEGVALAEMRAGRRAGARLVLHGQPDYPVALGEISDAPPLFWAVGNTDLLSRPMVAMVGARNASSLGLRMARKLAEGMAAAGLVVVSGLARGIDTAAHSAALSSGTVAVLAGGVDVTYPSENADLMREMARRGLLLSEQPIGLQPQARHFPQRNRIISGLARAVVVVEAAARSGSLITARLALDQGREVMAVPGHPLDARAAGCNMLVRDGALLVRSGEDVLAALGTLQPGGAPAFAAAPEPAARQPAHRARSASAVNLAACEAPALPTEVGLSATVLERIGPSPLAEDQLIRDLALSAAALAPVLLALEIDGQIERQPGGLLARVV